MPDEGRLTTSGGWPSPVGVLLPPLLSAGMLLCLTRPAVGDGGNWLDASDADVEAIAAASSAAATAATLRGGLLLLLLVAAALSPGGLLLLLLGCAAGLLDAA